MTFHSVLFEKNENRIISETLQEPDFFVNLNLDQIINAITDRKQEYNLKPFFYTALNSVETIKYRQEIMRDLENESLFNSIKSFAQKIKEMRRYADIVDKLNYKYHKEGWFLEAVEIYCEAINCLVNDLSLTELKSRGLLAFRDYMRNYAESINFTTLQMETNKLRTDLSTVKYCILIKGTCIKVRKYEEEIDYSIDVVQTFEKFKLGAVKDYKVKFSPRSGMNHVEAGILDLVAKLYPDIFLRLDNYCEKNSNYLDETTSIFDREIQFYVAYLEYISKFKREGLKFCYPQMFDENKEVYNYAGFDLALANKLITQSLPIVYNDFYLKDQERIFVVSGPNQGGKTTFARTFGQLHYLASIGCAVPGREAQLFLFDKLFTHFEKEENITNLNGKLQDDLIRIYDILKQATPNSIIIMNEIFTSTTLKDAILLGKRIMEKIVQLDLLCVCVTFIDELASFSDKTVSLVSTIVPERPEVRTYKIVRSRADGLSYAISIAKKHHVTYECLKERIK
ncbi:MAG: DNA mismatch repair protein MutS [Firmicutes bacterium HGW-Firmicutes-1]|nr:MAG: DNA mismatch repair protein MutS [Firmicutes bacterium HGW-Firmicutes-1]